MSKQNDKTPEHTEQIASINDPDYLFLKIDKVVKQADQAGEKVTEYWQPSAPWLDLNYRYPFIFNGVPYFSRVPYNEEVYPPPMPKHLHTDYKITMAAAEIARILNHYHLVGEFSLISPTHARQFYFFPPPPLNRPGF